MVTIDINKKLQDQANDIVNKASNSVGGLDPYMKEMINELVVMSLRQGFIWGVSSMKQVAEIQLKDIKGEEYGN